MDIIKVENLVFDYPNKRALNNVSFSIPEGAVVALVGPNGAGKTTLMRCMVALEKSLYGSIHINGMDVIAHPRECHKNVGYLSDFFGVYDELSVMQHLNYISQSYGITNSAERINHTLQAVNLLDYANKDASELSRGLRQRLGIAMAMIHKPKVLILDEPASGLDPEARYSLSQLFVKLSQSGMTLISSSHILAELSEYSSHMLMIEEGSIIGLFPVSSQENMQEVYIKIIHDYRQGKAT